MIKICKYIIMICIEYDQKIKKKQLQRTLVKYHCNTRDKNTALNLKSPSDPVCLRVILALVGYSIIIGLHIKSEVPIDSPIS